MLFCEKGMKIDTHFVYFRFNKAGDLYDDIIKEDETNMVKKKICPVRLFKLHAIVISYCNYMCLLPTVCQEKESRYT